MDNWDNEDVQPQVAAWDGEDEDDDLKDNWDDDDDDEEGEKEVPAPAPTVQPKKGGKQYLKQKLKEKEEQERLKMEKRREEEANKTPEEKMREKLLAQKLSEESDLEVTKEMFGAMDLDEKQVALDNFQPCTKEDFTKYSSLLKDKFTSMESSPHYFFLLQDLLSSALVNLETDRLKQLSSSINVLYTEKLKQERQKKGGKKTQKAKLGGGVKASRQDAMEDFSQYNNDFDDFM